MLKRLLRQRGVTLVELMIGLVILGMLISLAVPSFQDWIRNSQIRNGADAMVSGLQLARNEAISRNAAVQFRFDKTAYGWQVWDVASNSEIRAWSPQQGARNTTITATPTNATMVTFNAFGRVVANPVASGATPPTLTQLEVDAASGSTTTTRKLRVTINSAGGARMCDPGVAAATPPDPRAC